MSAEDTLADVSAVIVALQGVSVPQGKLTVDETKGLAVAGHVLGVADLIVDATGDSLGAAVMQVLSGLEPLARLAMGLHASMRRVQAKAEKATVIVGNIGPGVRFEAVE